MSNSNLNAARNGKPSKSQRQAITVARRQSKTLNSVETVKHLNMLSRVGK